MDHTRITNILLLGLPETKGLLRPWGFAASPVMSYGRNSLKGVTQGIIWGSSIWLRQRDTRSLTIDHMILNGRCRVSVGHIQAVQQWFQAWGFELQASGNKKQS